MNNSTRLLVALVALCVSSLCAAQWQWVDKDGRKIFSDRAPPPDVPEKSILKRPGKAAPEAVAKDEAAISAPAEAEMPAPVLPDKKSGIDKDLEAKKKQAAQAEADKRKAEVDRINKARAENCTRAKQAKMTFDSGVRVGRTNAAGEREIMDDATRAAEVKRLEDVIARDCKVQ